MLPFCEVCHDVEEEFNVGYDDKEIVIKGRKISYIEKKAYCKNCGSILFVPDIHDSNLEEINKAYWLSNVTDIEKALDIYKIGKRPLSLVLGWGEGTITRYLNGDIPTKQYSQTLQKINDDPGYMMELLELNKKKISDLAYKNCKTAIEVIEKQSGIAYYKFDQKKIDDVVQYLLYKCVEITPLALQKLLYYSQSFSKVINNVFLFEDDCEAWVHGPVYRRVYEKYKTYGYNPIEHELSEYNFSRLSESERDLLDSVINNFGCFSGKMLEAMTHIESPWREQRKGLGENEPSDRNIPKESLEQYFMDVKTKYKMLNTSDIRDYAEDLFRKLHFNS